MLAAAGPTSRICLAAVIVIVLLVVAVGETSMLFETLMAPEVDFKVIVFVAPPVVRSIALAVSISPTEVNKNVVAARPIRLTAPLPLLLMFTVPAAAFRLEELLPVLILKGVETLLPEMFVVPEAAVAETAILVALTMAELVDSVTLPP